MTRTGFISVSQAVTHSVRSVQADADLEVRNFEDIKPDNILVDWAHDEQGQPRVDKVALGDFDLALHLVDDRPLRAPYAPGNVMWRSPEGQSGKGIAKASDIYSLGLVVSAIANSSPQPW